MSRLGIPQAIAAVFEHHQAKNYAMAEKLCRQILAQSPQQPEALFFLGLTALDTNKFVEAENWLARSAALLPNNASVWHAYGLALGKQNRDQEAIVALKRSLFLSPDLTEAKSDLAGLLLRNDQANAGIAQLRKVLQLCPTASAMNGLGSALGQVGNYEEAIEHFRAALELVPNDGKTHANLGRALCHLDRFDEGITVLLKATELDTKLSSACCDLGTAYLHLGRVPEARAEFEKAIEIDPTTPKAQTHLAMVLLLQGEMKTGWKVYESRWTDENTSAVAKQFPERRWRGQDLAGKTILLQAEQGFGDTIQFVRYAAMIKKLGAKVLLECPRVLERLLTGAFGIDHLVAQEQVPSDFNFYCPLMSLPGVFGTELFSVPNDVPYLKVEESLVAKWKDRLVESSCRKVGIAWSGHPGHQRDRFRSLKPADLSPLADSGKVEFYSLQPLRSIHEGKLEIKPLLTKENDFADAAAIMMSMDLIVSADTAPLHLAGALGRPTWAMIPFNPDFRWLLGREYSPWYPTMRLFRQSKLGDWLRVVHQIKREMEAFLGPTD